MENFNFLNDRPPLTPDEVQAHKDFDKLLQQYKSAPVKFYKTGWFKAGLATVTVAVTGTILFFATGPQNDNKPDQNAAVATANHSASPYADETPCVKSPTPQINVAEKTFTINNERDTVLYYETGSSIQIKAHSLTSNGSPVKGEVTIRYREFQNPVEVFASGIPMQYDSAGKKWNLQSAGMIEITAWQGNQRVDVLPEQPLTIQMTSGQPNGEFNVYYLDTAQRNWNFKGRDELTAQIKNQKPEIRNSKSEINHPPSTIKNKPVVEKLDSVKIKKELQASLPMKPRHLNPKAFSFTLDVVESEFPELAVYGKTKFEVEDKNNVFDNKIYSLEWEDASLKTVTPGEKYELTLTRGVIRKTFNVIPVLEGKDYTTALEVYRKKYKEYEDKLSARLKEEKRKIEQEKAELSRWEREQAEKHRLRIQEFTASNMPDQILARFGADNSNKSLVTRAFTMSKFGIWNCDKPADFPAGEKVMAKFYDESGEEVPMTVAYLCEKDKKFIYTYNPDQFHRFTYNPTSKNIIWGIRKDGKIVYGLENAFAAENKKGREMIFKLNVVDHKFTSLKQVRDLLNI